MFDRASEVRRSVIHLGQLQLQNEFRGGGPSDGGTKKEKQQSKPAKWESTIHQAGLMLKTRLTAQKIDKKEDLEPLNSEDFAQNARGYAMLSWETWLEQQLLTSTHPLIAVLPGARANQVLSQTRNTKARIVVKEVVMSQPKEKDAQGETRYFAQMVTIIKHTQDEKVPKFEVEPRSSSGGAEDCLQQPSLCRLLD